MDNTINLIKRARGGDEQAREDLFESIAGSLLVYVRGRMHRLPVPGADPCDLVQDTFVEVIRSFDKFEHRGSGSLRAWACGIAERVMNKGYRHQAAQKRKPPEGLIAGTTVMKRLRDSTRGVGTRVAASEQEALLHEAIEELPEELREVIVLREFRELTYEQIHEELGIATKTVQRRITRAHTELARLLNELDSEPIRPPARERA